MEENTQSFQIKDTRARVDSGRIDSLFCVKLDHCLENYERLRSITLDKGEEFFHKIGYVVILGANIWLEIIDVA